MLSSFVASRSEVFRLFARLREQARSHRGPRWMRMFRLILAEVGDPRGGHFSVVATGSVKENPPVLLVETQYLEWADHAE